MSLVDGSIWHHNIYTNWLCKIKVTKWNDGCIKRMPGMKVLYFTKKEEEFTDLLITIGLPRIVAKVLVFLANAPEASSRDIERGADLRQPEVSLAMQYLYAEGWVASRLDKTDAIGRPQNIFRLARPIEEIIGRIQAEKESEIRRKMDLAQKIRNYVV
jgi:predicted transcriptional regulator